ncbi:dihydrolipoyl dehydrogenase [mine drainage metagenome]|uniref:dihydrolipoyl dehydrogenase n=1 Tax=mine drainage metagenome TaxID=410659 RepID=A0A1J5RCF4_9ZZZZ
MSQLIAVTVPDIGDFHDVPVIEVMVKAGDSIKAEDPLLTLESDKAALEVPSPAAGVVREVKLKIGDKVSQGTLVLLLETAEAAEASAPAAAPAAAPTPAPAAQAAASADLECDLLVLGAGPGGYSAAFRAADLGLSTVLVERHATLGGVCLNVGCIPSKALLHVAAVMEEAAHFSKLGVTFAAPTVDLDRLRAHKNAVVARLTGGLTAMAKARKVTVLTGVGRFLDPHQLTVEAEGGKKLVKFKNAIIAAGSRPVRLPFVPEDPRIVDSTGALELAGVPEHLLVIGGGIIGLEMATVYSALGAKISVVEMQDGLMPGADRDLVKVFEKRNARRFDKVMLETRVTAVEVAAAGLKVSFEGKQAPPGAQLYDRILVAVGRTPNGAGLDAERAGVAVDARGFIPVDRQMRTNVPHIFAIGDLVGQPMLAHKAVHEGHVAAEAAAGMKSFFDAAVIPSVAYTDPEIAWVGVTEEQAKTQNIAYERGLFPWAASGRAIANGADDGFTKLLFDAESGRIIGGAIVGPNAGDLIGEVALAIEMGADSVDIGKTIHPHPTLGESIGLAAEAAHGTCTDLPPKRKK